MTTRNDLVDLIGLPLFSSAFLLLLGKVANKWGHLFATLVSASTFGIGLYEFVAMRSRSGDARAATQKIFEWISSWKLQG
jgi:NADH-quinone oxidoreductase subunit L